MAVHHRIDVRPRLVNLAVDEALAVKQHAVIFGIDRLAVEIEHQDIGRGDRFRRDRTRDHIAVRIARIAHADMAEGVEHVKPRQRAIGGDEIVDQTASSRPEARARRDGAARDDLAFIYRISRKIGRGR